MNVNSVEDYLAQLPAERQKFVGSLRDSINRELPAGYEEHIAHGMISWDVPLTDYPDTYNGEPLAIAALASRKAYVAVYLNGLYLSSDDERWFRHQFTERGMRLDMGKSCVRFRRLDEVPLDVLGEAVSRVSPRQLIALYEASRERSSSGR